MIQKENFMRLAEEQKENVIDAMMQAKYKGFTSKAGVVIDVPAGYSVRAATVLTCEEQHETVKKIFVILEESNDFIDKFDINTVMEWLDQLKQAKQLDPERDDFWLITTEKLTFEAYDIARGNINIMDVDTFLEGAKKYYEKSRELRDILRHYQIIQ